MTPVDAVRTAIGDLEAELDLFDREFRTSVVEKREEVAVASAALAAPAAPAAR